MAAELRDFRGKLTMETACVLEAERRSTKRDIQEIVRNVMHAWAMARISKASLLDQLLRGQGIMREAEGTPGSAMDELFPAFADSRLHDGLGQ